ncbi:MAG: DUF4214 domain-containing protein [Synechococcales cyanobacterium CRU_2_2]|nr:DUF4214 domain-containing protein [Synechococcales cyanobacterium CRU_2_2]
MQVLMQISMPVLKSAAPVAIGSAKRQRIAILGSVLLSSLLLGLQPAAAQQRMAQQRMCIVEEERGIVYCGRLASDREIVQAGQRDRDNRNQGHGGYGGGYDNGDYHNGGFDRNSGETLRQQINEVYQDILGRRADRNGLNTYGRKLQSGWRLDRVRQDLANSDEARDRLNDIYRRVLNRDIDSGGLKTYRRRLAGDWSLIDVEQDVRQSDEARRVQGR